MSDTTTVTIDTTDLASIAAAIKAGVTTVELMAEYLDVELVDGCLVLDGTPITADDGNAAIEFDADEFTPAQAAEQYVEGGDWGDRKETIYVEVSTWRDGIDADGDGVRVEEEGHTITLEPEEPDCTDGEEHVWRSPVEIVGGIRENPGCWGHGGGIVQHSVCVRCGCGRVYDSWAQNPANGVQGLDSTSYEAGKYADEVEAMHLAAAVDALEAEEAGGDYLHADNFGDTRRADRDQMIGYGRAVVCGDDAELPGEVVEDDDAE